MVRCVVKACGRYYHSGCLDDWLQTKTLEPGKVMCPTHTCHTCASDDPRNTHFSCSKDTTLSRCIKCPTTFHADSNCIPAGVRILTGNQHICIRHRKETKKPVSLNWCYICGGRGKYSFLSWETSLEHSPRGNTRPHRIPPHLILLLCL